MYTGSAQKMRPAHFSKSGFVVDKPLPPLRPDSHKPHPRSSMPPPSDASRGRAANTHMSHYLPRRLASTSPDPDTAYVRARLRNEQTKPAPAQSMAPNTSTSVTRRSASSSHPSQAADIKQTGLERASGSSIPNRRAQPSHGQAAIPPSSYKGTSASPPGQDRRVPVIAVAPSLAATGSRPKSLSPRAAEKQPALPPVPQGNTPLVRRRLQQPIPEARTTMKKPVQTKPPTSSIPFPRPMSTPSASQRPPNDRPISPGSRSVFDLQRDKILRGQAKPSLSPTSSPVQPRPYHTWSEREQFKKSQTSLPQSSVPFPPAAVPTKSKQDAKKVWKMIDNLMDEVHDHMHRAAEKSGNRMTHPPMTPKKLRDPDPQVPLPKESKKERQRSVLTKRGRHDRIEPPPQPQQEVKEEVYYWPRTSPRSVSPSPVRDETSLYTTISRNPSITSNDSIVFDPTFFSQNLRNEPEIEFSGPFLPVNQLPARFQQLLKNAEKHQQQRKMVNALVEPEIVDSRPVAYHRDVATVLSALRTETPEEDWREVLSH